MRQTSAGSIAGIVIRYEDGSDFLRLCNPFNNSIAWQWVSMEKRMLNIKLFFQFTSSHMTLELTHCNSNSDVSQELEFDVTGDSYNRSSYFGVCFNESSLPAMFYFDDLHVSYKQGTCIVINDILYVLFVCISVACVCVQGNVQVKHMHMCILPTNPINLC